MTNTLRLQDPTLTIIVVVCSLTSVGAFLLDAFGLLAMPFTISFISLPALLVTLVVAVWAGRFGRQYFLRRLYIGLVAGLIATLAYDAIRATIMVGYPGDFNPFRSHPNFGALILDTSPATTAAHLTGWAYHFWNGISFGIIFVMLAGGVRFYYALIWALALETATVTIYPNVFDISRSDWMFVAVSFIGHAVYGLTLGVLSREWLTHQPWPRDVWQVPMPNLRRGLS
jgi:hypothetical protein